jgi:hypothetical protein
MPVLTTPTELSITCRRWAMSIMECVRDFESREFKAPSRPHPTV